MRVYDITRELLSAQVFPGDPHPEVKELCRIEYGDVCNTSALSMCAHNGTHLDAPLHFIPDGTDTASISLDCCVGRCSVVEFNGILLGADAEEVIRGVQPRLLFKGDVQISPSAAFVLSTSGIKLVGVEAQSVTMDSIGEVHRQLLGNGVVLLEGLDLSRVPPGDYFLFAPPLKIAGCDGSPVRAILCEL
ncbi:MAG TPA: cyclase [Clostridiales bacterium]|nr:cyclase [Clostridiales bacterium]